MFMLIILKSTHLPDLNVSFMNTT